jgi:hypothetical protein
MEEIYLLLHVIFSIVCLIVKIQFLITYVFLIFLINTVG